MVHFEMERDSPDHANLEDVELFFKAFGPRADKALIKSLKRAASSIKNRSGKKVSEHYNIKSTAVKQAATVKLNRSEQDALVNFRSMRIPLVNFGASPRHPHKIGRPKAKLAVKVKASRKTVRGAFIARMESGHTGVFQRTGQFGRNNNNDLERIEELTSVSIPQMVGNAEVREWVWDYARESFDKNFKHEMSWLLQQGGK